MAHTLEVEIAHVGNAHVASGTAAPVIGHLGILAVLGAFLEDQAGGVLGIGTQVAAVETFCIERAANEGTETVVTDAAYPGDVKG